MEEGLHKYLLMLCVCLYILLPHWTCVPPGRKHEGLYAVLCIQYRPGFNTGRLTSGPRTRVFAAGQEALFLRFLGLSLQYWGYLW